MGIEAVMMMMMKRTRSRTATTTTRSVRSLGAHEIQASTMVMFVASVMVALLMSVMLVAAGDDSMGDEAGVVVGYPVEKMTKESSVAAAAAARRLQLIACSFPNTSMVSLQDCSDFNGQSSISQLEICLPFLMNEDATPSAECCSSLTNVSTVLPACFCKVTFYPPQLVNSTQQKLMPSLCNITTDLCQACPQYMVARTNNLPDWSDSSPTASSAHLASKALEYKTTMTWLAVVLALTLAAIAVAAAFWVHRRWTAKKSNAPLSTKMGASDTGPPPGGNF